MFIPLGLGSRRTGAVVTSQVPLLCVEDRDSS
jgi:hypothetical protein